MAILTASSTHKSNNAVSKIDDSAADDLYMVVLDMVRVEIELYHMVETLFSDLYPSLIAGAVCSPEDLIGEAVWAELGGVSQRHAIYCLTHLAQGSDAQMIHFTSGGISFFEILKADGKNH